MPGLSLSQASTIVDTALKKARETGCAPLAVAVLDDGGHLKAFAREDGAGIIRPQIAFGKAWGALGMGMGSRAFARRLADNPQQAPFFAALSAMSDGRVVPVPGGVLIRDASRAWNGWQLLQLAATISLPFPSGSSWPKAGTAATNRRAAITLSLVIMVPPRRDATPPCRR